MREALEVGEELGVLLELLLGGGHELLDYFAVEEGRRVAEVPRVSLVELVAHRFSVKFISLILSERAQSYTILTYYH
jgi:hypothetical protein